MDDDKSIYVQGLGNVLFIDRDVQNFFRRTTLMYGPSETGKTTLVYWILYILRAIIPNVIVISPTEGANNSWKGRIPARCVRKNIDVKNLYDILARQKRAVDIYNKANVLEILEKLVNRAGDTNAKNSAWRIKQMTDECIAKIEKSPDHNHAERGEIITELKERCRNKLISIYKASIIKHREQIETQSLTTDEKYSLKFLHFNPSLLLILDDCASQFDKWGKDSILAELFYEGRHWWITTIITMQDDKKLPTGIRKNTFNNFFTDANCAITFFSNKANGFSKVVQRHAEKLIEYLFQPNANGTKNFKKMVYSRLDKRAQLRYIIADTYPVFRMGCDALWKLCEAVPTDKTKEDVDKSDKFYGSFRPD